MASPVNALVCALIATAFWSLLGYALGSRLVPRVVAIGAAPVIGWSVHSAACLPIYLLFEFSPFVVAGIGAVCVLIAGFSLSQPRSAGEIEPAQTIPVLAFAGAAVVSLLPAATILPKSSAGAVWLADATFDHAKIAIVDARRDSVCRRSIPCLAKPMHRAAWPTIIFGISAPPRLRLSRR
jgi:hypothetical protein